jgi:hypothetical protein
MDPIGLIIAALVAGATAGAKDLATDTIKDAYAGLKELIKRRFKKSAGRDAAAGGEDSDAPKGGGVDAEAVLEAHESAPETWERPMREALERSGADHDDEILSAAQALLDAAGAKGQSGKYRVDARGAQGVQVGDRGQQTNTFGIASPVLAPGDP